LRGAHVGVQAIFLAAGVVWMLQLSGFFGVFELDYMRFQVRRGESALAMLHDPKVVADELGPVLSEFDADGRLRAELERQLQEDRAYLSGRLTTANLGERLLYEVSASDQPPEDDDLGRLGFLEMAERARGAPVRPDARRVGGLGVRRTGRLFRDVFPDVAVRLFSMLAFFPAAWVIWAFATRGGLTFALMGLTLVRADGRRAARWRCAWRVLLVWAPVVAPLAACMWLKVYAPGRHLLHTGLWWLAVGVLIGEVVLAVLRPRHAFHDRLAGTYVVPL
jgi:hypothetical protein